MVKIQLVRLLVGTHTNAEFLLIDISQKRSKPSVPGGKDRAVVGIPLFYNDRVVNPVHGWRNKQNPKNRLKPSGHLQAAVMKLGTKDQHALKDQHAKRTGPEKKDLASCNERPVNPPATHHLGQSKNQNNKIVQAVNEA